jgi:hypothetical protein
LAELMGKVHSKSNQKIYPSRLSHFFAFLKVRGETQDNQTTAYITKAKSDTKWAEQSVAEFIRFQTKRMESHEIGANTVMDYIKPIVFLMASSGMRVGSMTHL